MGRWFRPNRAAKAAPARRLRAFAPFSEPVVIDEHGHAWLPNPHRSTSDHDETVCAYVFAGLHLGWAPMPQSSPGDALLAFFGGRPTPGSRYEASGVAAFITHEGLTELIADLQSIADSIGPQS